jgi:hypothetical protein
MQVPENSASMSGELNELGRSSDLMFSIIIENHDYKAFLRQGRQLIGRISKSSWQAMDQSTARRGAFA